MRLSLSSRFENIEMAQHLCGKLLEGRELSEETKHWVLMALREGLANAIKHGNSQNVAKRVHVEMRVEDILEIGFATRDPVSTRHAWARDPLAPENRLTSGARHLLHEDLHGRRPVQLGRKRAAWRIVLTKNLNAGNP